MRSLCWSSRLFHLCFDFCDLVKKKTMENMKKWKTKWEKKVKIRDA